MLEVRRLPQVSRGRRRRPVVEGGDEQSVLEDNDGLAAVNQASSSFRTITSAK
jgi:hypothetical protein